MSHDALRLLTAQATTEVRMVDGTSPIGDAGDDYDATYMAAVRTPKPQLRAALDAIVAQLAERDWEPPWSDEDDG